MYNRHVVRNKHVLDDGKRGKDFCVFFFFFLIQGRKILCSELGSEIWPGLSLATGYQLTLRTVPEQIMHQIVALKVHELGCSWQAGRQRYHTHQRSAMSRTLAGGMDGNTEACKHIGV